MQPRRLSSSEPVSPLVLDAAHAHVVADSHERCRALGLRAEQLPDLTLLERADLRIAQERNRRLCEQAMPVLELLWEQLSHTHSIVGLTDSHGTVLHVLGDAGFLDRAQRVALVPGAVWSEASKGTNAVGTALMNEDATLVHGAEHYLRANHFLTCSAAPIFDHTGSMIGVIDVSGEQRSYHPHTLALARMSARLIENQWFADRFRHRLKLHVHAQPAGLGTVQEGVIALDADGRILGANRCALDLLGRNAVTLRHESVEMIFGVSLARMIDHARLAGDAPMALALMPPSRGGTPRWPATAPASSAAGERGAVATAMRELASATRALYVKVSLDAPALVHAPVHMQGASPIDAPAPAVPVAAAAPRAATLRERELAAITEAVAAAGGNMARAARTLGIGRSTLYRKWRARANESAAD